VSNSNAEQIGLPKWLKRKLKVNSLGFIFGKYVMVKPYLEKEAWRGMLVYVQV
jgi:hypothetical protein